LKRAPWILIPLLVQVLLALLIIPPSHAWFDETHIAVAKVAGYSKWFNACGPDMMKVKMGDREGHNHYVNNPRGTVVTPRDSNGPGGEVMIRSTSTGTFTAPSSPRSGITSGTRRKGSTESTTWPSALTMLRTFPSPSTTLNPALSTRDTTRPWTGR
jgi:hypothetical protein